MFKIKTESGVELYTTEACDYYKVSGERLTGKEDIADNTKSFFDTFGIKEQEITLEQRESLEIIFTQYLQYRDIPTVFSDEDAKKYKLDQKIFEHYGEFTLAYYSDQWHACALLRSVKVNNDYYYQEVCRGEGDSLTNALLGLCILCKDLLDEDTLKWIRTEIFNCEDHA